MKNSSINIVRNGKSALTLKPTINHLRRRFGQAAIMRLDESDLRVRAISTGFPTLDSALGIGGIPRGRITNIYGPKNSGKSTLCLNIIAQAQKQDRLCLFIDTEHTLDPAHAAYCDVNLNELYIAQPDSGEEVLEIAEAIIRVGAGVVVIDSAAALLLENDLKGEMSRSGNAEAVMMSTALRKLVGVTRKNNTALIFTNQLRKKNGVLFGSSETSTGGVNLRFYAAVQIRLRQIKIIKTGQQITNSRVRAVVEKNKVAPPFRTAEFDIHFGEIRGA